MRTLIFDQFEFGDPHTEERLEISVSSHGSTPATLTDFVAMTVGVDASLCLPPPQPFTEGLAYGLIRRYLTEFAGIAVPEPCSWPCHVLADGPDASDLIISAPNQFIRYNWSTNA
jgi:hypothetical protein